MHVSRPREERESKIRIEVECRNLKSLERLWEDYSSGHLNRVAQSCLLTDGIKERFGVETINIETKILKQDYLACKEFLLGNPRKL